MEALRTLIERLTTYNDRAEQLGMKFGWSISLTQETKSASFRLRYMDITLCESSTPDFLTKAEEFAKALDNVESILSFNPREAIVKELLTKVKH